MIVSATKNCSCCSGVIWVDESNFVYKELWEQLRDSTRLLITIATSLAETQQYASLYRTLKPKPGVRGTLQSLCSVPRPFHLKCEECYWNPSVQSSVKSFQWNVPVSFFYSLRCKLQFTVLPSEPLLLCGVCCGVVWLNLLNRSTEEERKAFLSHLSNHPSPSPLIPES